MKLFLRFCAVTSCILLPGHSNTRNWKNQKMRPEKGITS